MHFDEARPHPSPPCGSRRGARGPRGRLRRLEVVRCREPRARHGRRLDAADDDGRDPAGLPDGAARLRQVPARRGLQDRRPDLPAGRRRWRRLLRQQRHQPQRPEVPEGAGEVSADPGCGTAAVQPGQAAEVPGCGAQVRAVHAQERRRRPRPGLLGRRGRSRRWRRALRRQQHRPKRSEGHRLRCRRAGRCSPTQGWAAGRAAAEGSGRRAERPGRDEPRGR